MDNKDNKNINNNFINDLNNKKEEKENIYQEILNKLNESESVDSMSISTNYEKGVKDKEKTSNHILLKRK